MSWEFSMRELVKIETEDVLSFYLENNPKDNMEIVSKTENKQSKDTTRIYEEDETSIYEYDIDCLKKRGCLDQIRDNDKK